MITPSQFKEVFPRSKNQEAWCAALRDMLPMFGINTKHREAMFLAQCGHESAGWSTFVENLNYSAAGLRKVFGKYFPTDDIAAQYARRPEKIASRAYGGRMGNGPEESGDGWKYRGRGLIQLTGKNNYTAFSMDTTGTMAIVDNPDIVAKDIEMCLKSALWFWKVKDLNRPSDAGDVRTVTLRINGGTRGLEERAALFNRLMSIL